MQFERHSLIATKSKLERALQELSERYGKLLENPNTPKIVLDQINGQLEETQTKIIDLNEELQKVEARIFDPDQLRMSQENFTNLIINGADKMRAGSSLEKDILARRIFTNLEIGAQKRLFHLCREPFNYLVWLGMRDSNPRMVGPEPTALPLGESPSDEIILCQ